MNDSTHEATSRHLTTPSSGTMLETTSSEWISEISSEGVTVETSSNSITETSFQDGGAWTTNHYFTTEITSSWVTNGTIMDSVNISDVPEFSSVTMVTDESTVLISSGEILQSLNHDIFTKHLFPSLIYVTILLVMGIPGNSLILYIYNKHWSKTTSRIFILALAAFDLLNAICSISIEIFILARFILFDIPSLCKVSRFVTCILNHGSAFLLVAIAYDRFRRICQPLRVQFNSETAKKIVISAIVFGFATSWPSLLLYGTYTIKIPIPNTSYIVLGKTCLIDDSMATKVYPLLWILFLLLSHFVIDITLVVLYTCVGRAVFKRRSKLKTRGSYKKAEISATSDSNETIEVLDSPTTKNKYFKQMSFVFSKESSSVKMKRNSGVISGDGHLSPKIKDLAKPLEKKLKTRNVRAGRTTVMLFLVTVVFIVSYIPHTGIVILRSLRGKAFYDGMSDTGKVVYQLLLRSYFLNCVLNPIVYCFVNKQFRNECRNLLARIFCCKNEKKILNRHNTSSK